MFYFLKFTVKEVYYFPSLVNGSHRHVLFGIGKRERLSIFLIFLVCLRNLCGKYLSDSRIASYFSI
jgi:hypothetical protein